MATNAPTIIAGKYEVLGRLGQGGQASVFKVRHLGLGEVRALKLLPERGADTGDSVARFRREGRALARLRHPHIVQVFDLGRDGDQYYLEMEFVEGPNLAQYLKKCGRPPLAEALGIARQVAGALAYAHGQPYEDASGNRQAGLVHRDVKPSNILLGAGTPPHAMLADFGLVKLADTFEHTTVDTMLGTYRYSAPEQMGLKRDGKRVEVDGRADVFALGLVLYELLEGKQFHAGRAPDEILGCMVYGPSEVEPEFATPQPPAARELVRRMVRRWPEDRPASMVEVVHALDALIADPGREDDTTIIVPPPAQRPPAPEPPPTSATRPTGAPRQPSRNRRAGLVAGGALAALAVAWLLFGRRGDQAPLPEPDRRAIAPAVAPPPVNEAPTVPPVTQAPARETPPTVPPPQLAEPPPPVAQPVPPPPSPPTTLPAPEPPRIVAQRPSARTVTVPEGGAVEFSLQVDKAAAARGPRYRWLLDGQEVGSKPAWRFVAPPVQAARTQFRVEAQVTDVDGQAAPPASWTVDVTWAAPELTKPTPAAAKVRVSVGDQQAFRIQATAPKSAGSVRYEWSVDGKPTHRGSEPEFIWTAGDPGSHRVEVAAVDARGAWSTHRWEVDSVVPPATTTTAPVVAAVPSTTVRPPTTLPTLPPATRATVPPTTLPPPRAATPGPPDGLTRDPLPLADEAEAWVNRLRAAWAAKDLAALRAMRQVTPDEERTFDQKIGNNPNYRVRIHNWSIYADPRTATVTFDRTDTEDGRAIPQPQKTVRLERGPGGLVMVGR
jgi:serine/threonine-protein kinase